MSFCLAIISVPIQTPINSIGEAFVSKREAENANVIIASLSDCMRSVSIRDKLNIFQIVNKLESKNSKT
jgi:hypothetical protein